MARALTKSELHRWTIWKQATDRVWEHVAQAVAQATGLSTADFAVLTSTIEAHQAPRQQDLADELGWSRSRLSRQLSRMERRGLITRSPSPTATTIRATPAGRELNVTARAAHAEAVRSALLQNIPPAEGAFWEILQAIRRSRGRSAHRYDDSVAELA